MSRTRSLAGALIGVYLIGGCMANTVPDEAHASPVAEQVFDVGYSRIVEIYLKPVDLGQLTVDGLAGLRRIDSTLSFAKTDTALWVKVGGERLPAIALPSDTSSTGWAHVTTLAIAEARGLSPGLRLASAEDIYQAVFDGVTHDLDGYSRYTGAVRASAERDQREGYGGVGITTEVIKGRHIVTAVFTHSPAQRAGIIVGNAVVSIDGETTATMTSRDVRDLLRGATGSVVALGIGTGVSAVRSVPLRRERVIPNTVSLTVENGIGILKVDRFNAATALNLREAIDRTRAELGPNTVGFILDLRGNPGGLLDQAVAVADLFIRHGRIISTRGRHPESQQVFEAIDQDETGGLPIVVVVDGHSASASEIVAAALQDSGRAVLVGAESFGKGSVQTVTRLPNDGELFLTWSRIYAPSGYTLHRQGVLPTVCTSKGDSSAEAIMAHLRDGRISLPTTLASWRAAAPDDEVALSHLRETCPWQAHPPQIDITVAEDMLHDHGLYQRALSLTMTTIAQN